MTVTIRRADIARQLIKLGHRVVDIHKDKDFPSTNFVFAHDDTFEIDFNKVLNDLGLEDDVPTKREDKPFHKNFDNRRNNSSGRDNKKSYNNRKSNYRDNRGFSHRDNDRKSSRGGYGKNTIVEKAE